jgi:hypothetical protein
MLLLMGKEDREGWWWSARPGKARERLPYRDAAHITQSFQWCYVCSASRWTLIVERGSTWGRMYHEGDLEFSTIIEAMGCMESLEMKEINMSLQKYPQCTFW